MLRYENGKYMKPPYSPLEYPPLGTDNFNRNVLLVIMVGAKYTIGAAIIISALRVFPSVLIGLFLYFYMGKLRKIINTVIDATNYFPQTLLAFLLMIWVMKEGPLVSPDTYSYSFEDRIVIYILILAFISIPSLSQLFSNEVKKIMSYEFIDSARVLGATKRDFVLKHIKPFIIPQIFLVFIREFIAVMLLISHLGVLGIFIGGATLSSDVFNRPVFVSLSNEWSGLLGSWWEFLWTTYPWIPFIPVVFFTLTILSAKLMLNGIIGELDHDRKNTKNNESLVDKNVNFNSEERFSRVKHEFGKYS
ncbi:ABC transporter permease subunit [Rossellomorea sp. BNER]|nr:ABC transporter permease subunit [Rossellomorea sp. BNER]